MKPTTAGLLTAGLCSALIAIAAAPASAQGIAGGGLPRTPGFMRPIQTDIGMPLAPGSLNLSATAAVSPGMANTMFVLDAGLTPRLGLEVVAPYVGLGTGAAYLSELGADVQVGLLGGSGGRGGGGTGRAPTGLSAVLGLHVPGGSTGLTIGSIQPLVGLRGQGQAGPVLGIANVGWFPGINQTEIRAAGLWQVNPMLAPGLELSLIGGPASQASLTPEVQARPLPNLGIGLGYQIPIAGAATGQVVAQAQFLF